MGAFSCAEQVFSFWEDLFEDLPGDLFEDLPGDLVEDLPGDLSGDLSGARGQTQKRRPESLMILASAWVCVDPVVCCPLLWPCAEGVFSIAVFF